MSLQKSQVKTSAIIEYGKYRTRAYTHFSGCVYPHSVAVRSSKRLFKDLKLAREASKGSPMEPVMAV